LSSAFEHQLHLERCAVFSAALFSLIFWLLLYSADLLGPMLLVLLTRSSVRALLQ